MREYTLLNKIKQSRDKFKLNKLNNINDNEIKIEFDNEKIK